MPFTQVIKSNTGGRLSIDEVRMGWRHANAKSESRVIGISISRNVIEKLGWNVTKGEGKVEYFYTAATMNEGTHEDAGFLMLIESHERDGYRLGSSKSEDSTAAFSMGIVARRLNHYVINDIAAGEVDMDTVQFTIDDSNHSLLIECPDWLRYNPQSVPELPKAVEQVKEPTPAPREVKRGCPLEVETQSQDDQDSIGDKPVNKLNRQERRRVASYVARQLTR